MCSKRYPEPVDTKDMTVVGVAKSQCSVLRRNFVEDIQFPRLLRPLMAKFSEFLSNDIKVSTNMCVKFGLVPMSNFGFLWIFDFPRLI